ncbi:hypothetical protein CTAYLR_005600 [Chrysophaeum taylorii]|uniref:Glycosyltransferase 2-like domain-containing protein n=1 Tax=Chrysophaeum taylorii TaxID=2483200 RepID=A0AAD7XIW8_9STRA|nr:hypothetical protein CTAYLR_005600 [Chrysophaeum taylorii]
MDYSDNIGVTFDDVVAPAFGGRGLFATARLMPEQVIARIPNASQKGGEALAIAAALVLSKLGKAPSPWVEYAKKLPWGEPHPLLEPGEGPECDFMSKFAKFSAQYVQNIVPAASLDLCFQAHLIMLTRSFNLSDLGLEHHDFVLIPGADLLNHPTVSDIVSRFHDISICSRNTPGWTMLGGPRLGVIPEGTKGKALAKRFAPGVLEHKNGVPLELESAVPLDVELVVRRRTKAELQLAGAEKSRPCRCSVGECHIRKRRDGGFKVALKGLAAAKPPPDAPLVSVACPTTPERRSLHPLVYECFSRQTYGRLELVVYETGDASPSPFWLEMERRDERVRYAFDAIPHETVGRKRNLLVERAVGEVVAMCDDDNVYGPSYIETMVLHLVVSGTRLASLAGFFGVAISRDEWTCYRNVGGRGETLVFWRGGILFDEEVTWGEESTLLDAARPDGCHRVWDDVGIFLHVDHGHNFTSIHPPTPDSTRDDGRHVWNVALSGVEWRAALRDQVADAAALRILDDFLRSFYHLRPTPSDPKGERPPDDWYDLPDELKNGRSVLPRRSPRCTP